MAEAGEGGGRVSSQFEHAVRCTCGSAVFYDWGLKLMTSAPMVGARGNKLERYSDWASGLNVMICARCNTPYISEEGKLVDVSDELGAEEVRALIARGQAVLPHPAIKDP